MCVKKRLFYTLFLIAFASAAVLGNAFFVNAEEIGSVASAFSSGIGTKNDPYVIKTSAELEFFAESVNNGNSYEGKYIVLGADIIMNDETFAFDSDSGLVKITDSDNTVWLGSGVRGDKSGGNATFDNTPSEIGAFYESPYSPERVSYGGDLLRHTPIGKKTQPFSGYFDGCGYTVTGLCCIEPIKNFIGLFGYTEGASIRNVTLENSCICGNSSVGAIVGNLVDSHITSSASDASVVGGGILGGVVGHLLDSDLSECYNLGAIIGSEKVGGVVGVNQGDVTNSYNAGLVCADALVGGIAGQNIGRISTSYNLGKVFALRDFGAISGSGENGIQNSFYINGSLGEDCDGMTDAQMRDADTYDGFDFTSVWTLDDNPSYPYPTLVSVSHIYKEHIHTYKNDCDVSCDSCGYERKISHSYGSELQKDESAHYLVCSVCGNIGKVSAHKYDDACDSICNECSFDRNVYHDFSAAWYSDSKCHWNECTRCGERINEGAHEGGKEATEGSPKTCKICSYIIEPALGHKHSYTGKWLSSDDGHYKECECGQKSDLSPHEWDSGTITKFPTADNPGTYTYKCDVCARKRVEYVEDITDIIYPDNEETDASDGDTSEEILRENNVYPIEENDKNISLALSIGALVIGLLNLVMFAVIIVILLKKNENGRNK